ncbi:MAG: Ig-like domain-containing protein [Gemmatimonadetes bacterium]|nr:Ig-like domain-containing protein [Gemmatimonadota bacterium]
MSLIRRLLPLALIIVGLACGGGSEGPAAPPPPPPPAVTTVEVSPATANLVAPGEVALTATVKDQNGNVMSGKTVAWSTSEATIATVSADGRVSVIRPGSATITATVEGKAGSATVTGLAPVARVAVSTDSLVLAAGDTVTLVATPRDAQGNPLPQRPVTWQSPDPTIATITTGGLLTAVGAGRIEVTARAESITTRVVVTVSRATTQLPPAGCTSCIELVPSSVLLRRAGEQQLVEAYSVDASGRRTRVRPTWHSSNPGEVRVDANGLVTAVTGSGSAQLTATANGLRSDPALVLVSDPVDGAMLVRDAQVVVPPVPVDTMAEYGAGYQFRMRLRGIPPTVGQVVLAAENHPIGGRVTTVTSAGAGLTDVVYAVVPVNALFKQLRIKQKITTARPQAALAAGAEAAYRISRTGRGAFRLVPRPWTAMPTPNALAAPGQFTIAGFTCQVAGSAPSFPLSLTTTNFTITPSALETDIDFGGPNPPRMLVLGDVDVQLAGKLTVTAAVQAGVNCKANGIDVPLPLGGPLGAILGGKMTFGVGFDAKMSVSLGGFGANISYAGVTQYEVGMACDLLVTTCPIGAHATPSGSASFAPFGPAIATQGPTERITLSGFTFADLKVTPASVPNLFQITLVGLQAGMRHDARLAGTEAQRADSTLATIMSLTPYFEAKADVRLSVLSGVWNLPLLSRSISSNLPPLAGTPRGRWEFVQDTVSPGVDVTFNMLLDSVPLTSAYVIESAEMRWYRRNQAGQAALQFPPNGCETMPRSTPAQDLFGCTFQFAPADTGWQYFHAFTRLKIFSVALPLPFEINDHAIDSIYVTRPSIRITPRAASVPVNQSTPFSASVTGSGNQVITWSATGGTITSNGVYQAGAQAGTFRVFARSAAFPSLVDTAIVTVTAPLPSLGISGTPPTGHAQGTPFSFKFDGAGGNGIYAFTATGLPAGITIASNGQMSGIPTQLGTSTYSVTVTSAGLSATRSYMINIFPADPWVGTWVGTQTVPNLGRTLNRTATGRPGTLGANRYQIDFGQGEICFLVVASDNSNFTGNCTDGFQNNLSITGARSGTTINARLGVCPVCSWSNGVINLTKQ